MSYQVGWLNNIGIIFVDTYLIKQMLNRISCNIVWKLNLCDGDKWN